MSSSFQIFVRKVPRLPVTVYRYVVSVLSFPGMYRAQNERISRLEAAQRQIQPFEADVPAILNFITSFAHTSHDLTRRDAELKSSFEGATAWTESLDSDVKKIWDRVEFVRQEILFELMHTLGKSEAAGPKTDCRILNQEKLTGMRQDIRINMGSGHEPLAGYLNLDQQEVPGVDVVADVTDMPFAPGSVSEIYSAHLIEHFSQEELRRRMLPYWVGLLRPGGVLRAILPDWEAMISSFAQGSCSFEDLRELTFGAQDYEGDFHFNMFSQDSLRRVLEEAGLKQITFPVAGRANGKCLEMEVTAVK